MTKYLIIITTFLLIGCATAPMNEVTDVTATDKSKKEKETEETSIQSFNNVHRFNGINEGR